MSFPLMETHLTFRFLLFLSLPPHSPFFSGIMFFGNTLGSVDKTAGGTSCAWFSTCFTYSEGQVHLSVLRSLVIIVLVETCRHCCRTTLRGKKREFSIANLPNGVSKVPSLASLSLTQWQSLLWKKGSEGGGQGKASSFPTLPQVRESTCTLPSRYRTSFPLSPSAARFLSCSLYNKRNEII